MHRPACALPAASLQERHDEIFEIAVAPPREETGKFLLGMTAIG